MPPKYFMRGSWPTQYLPSYFELSICNPVDSESYWSIDKFVGFGPPPPIFFIFLLHLVEWIDGLKKVHVLAIHVTYY